VKRIVIFIISEDKHDTDTADRYEKTKIKITVMARDEAQPAERIYPFLKLFSRNF
jgi:hypothetical protein